MTEYENDFRINERYLNSGENKTRKNLVLYGIRTHDLCETGTAPYQLGCHVEVMNKWL